MASDSDDPELLRGADEAINGVPDPGGDEPVVHLGGNPDPARRVVGVHVDLRESEVGDLEVLAEVVVQAPLVRHRDRAGASGRGDRGRWRVVARH